MTGPRRPPPDPAAVLDLDVAPDRRAAYVLRLYGAAVKEARAQGRVTAMDEPAVWVVRRLLERLTLTFTTAASERQTADLAREVREWMRELGLTPDARGDHDSSLDQFLAGFSGAPVHNGPQP